MHLFSRAVHMVGEPAETMAYAADMRSYVSDLAGQEVALWSGAFGVPLGSMMYTARVEGMAGFMAMSGAVTSDEGYHAKLAEGAAYRSGTPAQDQLGEPIYGELGGTPPPVGSIATITSAQITTGKYAEAFEWGVAVSQRVESVGGTGVMFMRGLFGPFGNVTWVSVYADASAADASNQAVNGDAEYMKLLGDIGGMFVEGSGHQSMAIRVA